MKKIGFMVAALTLTGAMLTGCNPAQTTGEILNNTEAAFDITNSALDATNSGIDKVIKEATSVYDYLYSGHGFVACEGNKAILLFYAGDDIIMEAVSRENGKATIENIDGQWDRVYEDLKVPEMASPNYDDYSWEMKSEGDLTTIELTVANKKVVFYELEESTLEEAEDLAAGFIKKTRILDSDEDISDVLEGYTGTSIVEAFIRYGLKPDFATREMVAAKVGIENYHGSADQNLELIRRLGGVVK